MVREYNCTGHEAIVVFNFFSAIHAFLNITFVFELKQMFSSDKY